MTTTTEDAPLDFGSIVRDHQERVRNTCFHFVKNRDDADDLAQEVFVQVYESLGHFRREAELSTWIYRISVNKSLDHIRRETRKKRFARLRTALGRQEEVQDLPGPAKDDPQHRMEADERRRLLGRALDGLPLNQRTAVTLSRCEGFTAQETAAIMGLSLPAVEALIHRAKKNLHERLSDYFEKSAPRDKVYAGTASKGTQDGGADERD